jgi:hypothetical protein
MNRTLSLLAPALAALSLAACASTDSYAGAEQARDTAKLAAAQAHAGQPEDHVRFLRPIHRYEVIDPHALLVWETMSKAWLVDLRASAACNQLEHTWHVAIDSLSDTLDTRSGYVRGEHGINCKIERIREVDVPAMRAALRESGNG